MFYQEFVYVAVPWLISPAQQFPGACIDQQEDVFQNALGDLAGSFLGEEEKGDPLSDEISSHFQSKLAATP